jgi:hypothetical protein
MQDINFTASECVNGLNPVMCSDTTTAVTLTQIGTVTIRRGRVYSLPGCELSDKNTAQVQPGEYPLVRQADGSVYWIMEAVKNTLEVEFDDLPEIQGAFAMRQNDRPSGKPFLLPSKVFSAEAFAEFAAEVNPDPSFPLHFNFTE